MTHRPVETDYQQIYPDAEYQDDFQQPYDQVDELYKPNYQDDYKPSHQDDYKPTYEDEYRPTYYEDDYKPAYEDDYKPAHNDYKPNYQIDFETQLQGFKPIYENEDFKQPIFDGGNFGKPSFDIDIDDDNKGFDFKPPTLSPSYSDDGNFDKPTYDDDVNYKPAFDEIPDRPNYADDFGADFNPGFLPPVDFELDFNNNKPDDGNNYDDVEQPKPGSYKPQKPYEPAYKPAPKPYKPKPEYPKQVVLLTPSPALKSSSYAYKHTTKDYHAGSISGVAGKDYPNYNAIPSTSFDCLNVKQSDSYINYMFPDPEAGCQVFHSCHADGRQDSFLCPEGTIFDAETQTCDWWFSARCYSY